MKVSGTLTKIYSKSGTNARGKWTSYRLGVDTGEGETQWFGHGFQAPKVTEGSYITFETKDDGRGGLAVDGPIQVRKSTPAAAQGGGKFRADDDVKQNSIVRQNATTTATVIARDMVEKEIVKLPAAGKRYDFYLALIDKIADHLYLNNRSPKSIEELAAEQEPAEDAVDEGDPEDEGWEPV